MRIRLYKMPINTESILSLDIVVTKRMKVKRHIATPRILDSVGIFPSMAILLVFENRWSRKVPTINTVK